MRILCKLADAYLLAIPMLLVPLIAMMLGSMWDRGDRYKGNIRADLPSTIGFLVGIILVFAYDVKIESLMF